MASERMGYIPTEVKKTGEAVSKPVKKGVLFMAEKSIYVTAPVTAVMIATGAVPFVLGAAMIGTDVVTSRWAGNKRRSIK